MEYRSKSSEALKSFAGDIIRDHARKPRTDALVFSLVGNLGAGKTTFAQGAARALGVLRPMPSPTFTIMREVDLPKKVWGIAAIYHFDWFRLAHKEDIMALGWKEIVANPQNLVLVEWGDKFPGLLPPHTVEITLSHAKTHYH